MSDINELRNFGKVQKFPKGQYIFQQGDPGREMHIILAGKVSVTIHSAVGDQIELTELVPGNFVGEMSVLENQPRSASVLTLEDTITLAIDCENFLRFMTNKPEWAMKIMQSLSNRLRKVNEKLSSVQMREEDVQAGLQKMMPGQASSVLSSESKAAIYPDGHGQYDIAMPEEYRDYLFDRKVQCPVCQREFTAKAVKSTRLRLKEVTRDFREKHDGFDKLWWNIWVCPDCDYAAFTFDFLELEKRPAAKLFPLLTEFRKDFTVKIDNDIRDINQLFMFYYLALNTRKLMKKVDFKVGKLWLNLAWLYQDAGDEKMFNYAYHTAFENYKHVLFNTRVNIPQQEEQRLFILLGEMQYRDGDVQEALKFYQNAIRSDQKSLFADQARDRIYEIREKLKAEAAEKPAAEQP
jgi:hypothetical protein